jgi:SagB-type dehydrogenase family enzyme
LGYCWFWALLSIALRSGIRGKQEGTLASLNVGESINLPSPRLKGDMSLEEAIAKRRSIRSYSPTPLTLQEISQLLWAAQGITEPNRGLRAAPSAGATYPYEVYVVTNEGVFHYIPKGHKLEKIKDGNIREDLTASAMGQASVRDAGAVFILTAIYERTARYGERAKLFVHLEGGHIAQNIHLTSCCLEIGLRASRRLQSRESEGGSGNTRRRSRLSYTSWTSSLRGKSAKL